MQPTGRVPPERYPWWVKFSLLGAKSRTAQWFWVLASLVSASALLVLAYNDRDNVWLVFGGLWGFAAAGLYFGTILWMDKRGDWDRQ